MPTEKFTWTKNQIEEIKIYFVWFDKDLGVWVYADKLELIAAEDEGRSVGAFTVIRKEFLGIPVRRLKEGAYDGDGKWIDKDDPILLV